MTDLRVIFFDAAGTLIGLQRSVAFHYCAVGARHGLDVPQEAMHEAFRMTWKEMPAPVTTRVCRPDDDRGWWRDFVDRVLDKLAVDERVDRNAYFDDLYVEFVKPGVWDVYPETREVLSALTGRFELGIISNFDRRLRIILDELGLTPLFKHIIISSEVGADKPDPWIFQEALRLANVDPPAVLHVGDEPIGDWEGATQAGMRIFKLKRPENSLRDLLPRSAQG